MYLIDLRTKVSHWHCTPFEQFSRLHTLLPSSSALHFSFLFPEECKLVFIRSAYGTLLPLSHSQVQGLRPLEVCMHTYASLNTQCWVKTFLHGVRKYSYTAQHIISNLMNCFLIKTIKRHQDFHNNLDFIQFLCRA
jgi:hypothetical protein